ncbi:MAG: hypothetical protein IBX55_10750 [Methyloprofundus sp.]|nr:hypothetical protein [Methyloprofundus sp.]
MTTQSINQARPLFALGQTLTTPGALVVMHGIDISPISLLSRHQCGDWGELNEADTQANEIAIKHGLRLFSSYVFDTVKLWVITEADRSATTILLPEEY